jgi:pSer/pThr/pTyr-binding forkhead associated (FHA) protein
MKISIDLDGVTYSHDLDKPAVTLGRSATCDLPLPCTELSREHCIFYKDDTEFSILDLGSKNGVSVDGEKIEPHVKVPLRASSIVVLANKYILNFTGDRGNRTISKIELIPPATKLPPQRKRVEKEPPIKQKKMSPVLLALILGGGLAALAFIFRK